MEGGKKYLDFLGDIEGEGGLQGETELSFRLIPSLAKITSSLTVLVWGFGWDWVKEGMSLKDNSYKVWAIAHGSIPQTNKGRRRKSMLIFIGWSKCRLSPNAKLI